MSGCSEWVCVFVLMCLTFAVLCCLSVLQTIVRCECYGSHKDDDHSKSNRLEKNSGNQIQFSVWVLGVRCVRFYFIYFDKSSFARVQTVPCRQFIFEWILRNNLSSNENSFRALSVLLANRVTVFSMLDVAMHCIIMQLFVTKLSVDTQAILICSKCMSHVGATISHCLMASGHRPRRIRDSVYRILMAFDLLISYAAYTCSLSRMKWVT